MPHPVLPTRSSALEVLSAVRPGLYARTRNHLEGAVTGLSPYLTHGILTLRESLSELLLRESLPIQHKLIYEFGWREFFRHVWSSSGDGILQSLRSGPLPDAAYALELPMDIRQACTGVPAIDESVRELYASGTLHNHARMWLASYVIHVRRIHWRAGADWLVAHLRDGDLASNHLSWQWVAGTFSSKPYLFNADNVARYAPLAWHSPGSVIDCSYAEMDAMARNQRHVMCLQAEAKNPTPEPVLHGTPPPELRLEGPAAEDLKLIAGREVWLVHPWAVRLPPADLPENIVIVGVYLRDYHEAWPWSAARWHWVDSAMAEVTWRRWWVDADSLRHCLVGASCVRSVDDPHIAPWLHAFSQLAPAPLLFPLQNRRCSSFSQWWKSATTGLHRADDLLSLRLS